MAEPECIRKHHFAKICQRCNQEGKVCKYWCGYVETPSASVRGAFDKAIDAGAPQAPIFLVNKSFGVHESWARRWAYRLYTHRASFQGEATIARALEPDLAAERLERELESAWVRRQLWLRASEVPGRQAALAPSLLELPLEDPGRGARAREGYLYG